MALTGSGQITYGNINFELGNGSSAEQNIETMASEAIVSYTTIVNEPHDITDWYSYAHIAPIGVTGTSTTALPNIGSTVDVTVTWNDNSSTESGFKIEEQKNGGAWVEKGTVGVGVTIFEYDAGACAVDDTYKNRVSSFNVAGGSAAFGGNTVTITSCVPI